MTASAHSGGLGITPKVRLDIQTLCLPNTTPRKTVHDTRSSPSETAFFKPSKVVTMRLGAWNCLRQSDCLQLLPHHFADAFFQPIRLLCRKDSFQNLSGIYNKQRGRVCPPRRNFLWKSLWFCSSPLAVGSQNRTASGKNSRCNKKAHPAFRQDAHKIACGYFQANGINLVHFAPKSSVFNDFIL